MEPETRSFWFSSRSMLNLIFILLLIQGLGDLQRGFRQFAIKVSTCDPQHVGDGRVDFDGHLWECVRVERDGVSSFQYIQR